MKLEVRILSVGPTVVAVSVVKNGVPVQPAYNLMAGDRLILDNDEFQTS